MHNSDLRTGIHTQSNDNKEVERSDRNGSVLTPTATLRSEAEEEEEDKEKTDQLKNVLFDEELTHELRVSSERTPEPEVRHKVVIL